MANNTNMVHEQNCCAKCGAALVVAAIGVIGYPGYVEGSRKEYCGYCDEPPVITLKSGFGGKITLEVEGLGNGK